MGECSELTRLSDELCKARARIAELGEELEVERERRRRNAVVHARELHVVRDDMNRALRDVETWRAAANPDGLERLLERVVALEYATVAAREARRILTIAVGETPLEGSIARYVPAVALADLVNGLAKLDELERNAAILEKMSKAPT